MRSHFVSYRTIKCIVDYRETSEQDGDAHHFALLMPHLFHISRPLLLVMYLSLFISCKILEGLIFFNARTLRDKLDYIRGLLMLCVEVDILAISKSCLRIRTTTLSLCRDIFFSSRSGCSSFNSWMSRRVAEGEEV